MHTLEYINPAEVLRLAIKLAPLALVIYTLAALALS